MSQRCLCQKPRICYYEPEEPNSDEYTYCDKCADLLSSYQMTRTIKIIPRFPELLVIYGSEFANELDIDLGKYDSPKYARAYVASNIKKRKLNNKIPNTPQEMHCLVTAFEDYNNKDPTTSDIAEESRMDMEQWKENNNSMLVGTADNVVMIAENMEKNIREADIPKLDKENCPKNNKNKIGSLAPEKSSQLNDLYHYCDICGKKFVIKCDLEKHMRFHDQNRAHACDVCTHRFSSPYVLKSHMFCAHQIKTTNNMKIHACEICGKMFNGTNKLMIHLRTHTGEKPYACTVCDTKFSHSTTLKIHMRTHTGERPYACVLCDMKFMKNTPLKRHMRIHTGERPYACTVCDTKFSHNSTLKRHMRTHTRERPYACTICDTKFSHSTTLKRHIRTHTGERPFSCVVCNVNFTRSTHLKKHMRTHTGERPFSCVM